MKLSLKKPSWTEKRDSVRLEVECPVTYKTVDTKMLGLKKTGKPTPGLIIKPSLVGVRLCSKEEIKEGTGIDLLVDMEKLGYDRSYFLQGKVMWSKFSGKTKRQEHGIRLKTKGGDYRRWEKFILENLKQTDRSVKVSSPFS